MTIENLLLSVCEAMTPELTDEQLTSLKDILFMKFRGIEIREESTAVQTAIGAEGTTAGLLPGIEDDQRKSKEHHGPVSPGDPDTQR